MKRGVGLVLLLFACRESATPPTEVSEGPVAWEVRASADKKKVQVGEPLTLTVTVRHPAAVDFLLPTGRSLEPFEVIERSDDEASPVETRIRLRVAAYRLPGDIAIPPLKVEYRESGGKLATVETKSIPVKLVTSLTPEVTDIHDLKGPIEDIPVPSRWSLLWWLLLALVVAALAYLIYRRLRRRRAAPTLVAPPAPLSPPEVEAERALRRLAEARLLEKGKTIEFYAEISEIMKRYAGRRFEVPYLERTTSEILYDLGRARVREAWVEEMRAFLAASDLVKFARVQPEREDSARMLPDAFHFLDQTRPRSAAEATEAA